MRERRITIVIDETREGKWNLTATLSQPFLRGKAIRWVPERTLTRTMTHPYADVLTKELLTEWVTALMLVAAGWYENQPLPFD